MKSYLWSFSNLGSFTIWGMTEALNNSCDLHLCLVRAILAPGLWGILTKSCALSIRSARRSSQTTPVSSSIPQCRHLRGGRSGGNQKLQVRNYWTMWIELRIFKFALKFYLALLGFFFLFNLRVRQTIQYHGDPSLCPDQ